MDDDPRAQAAWLYRLAAQFHRHAEYLAGLDGIRDEMAFRHAMQCAWLEVENAKLVRQIPHRETLEAFRRGGPPDRIGFDAAAYHADVAAVWLESLDGDDVGPIARSRDGA